MGLPEKGVFGIRLSREGGSESERMKKWVGGEGRVNGEFSRRRMQRRKKIPPFASKDERVGGGKEEARKGGIRCRRRGGSPRKNEGLGSRSGWVGEKQDLREGELGTKRDCF